MGYKKIENLYRDKTILTMFKHCFAMEKIHGTSAHLKFKDNKLTFFSGGEKYESFKKLFNEEELLAKYREKFVDAEVTIYGEAYGGKCQGMSKTYGPNLKFIAFEVTIGDTWLNVTNAEEVSLSFGLEFVDYVLIPTDIDSINAERDKDSTQAIRNGMGEGHMREGVILRPVEEMFKSNDNRIMVKHKRAEFGETKTHREISLEELKVISDANAISNEWVTEMRLVHVLDSLVAEGILSDGYGLESTSQVIRAMVNDVYTEAKGEIVESKATMSAIGKATAKLFKERISKI